ncbi:GNAT family N-acetyltransferase [Pseudoflavitalea sp. G-6-1-2]|uniref:GNAT family N-acetyltransferase n=1 Tax=Pseudoflavitalea sp. G-6-1-2 TaxID=2728841 RepID=UPI00146A8ADD|nr:GNAT family N-acetyltransferase [Pseudoflavitalea sp. G-6-1-2]NML21812.1 GNAT family N-acetyltransferase [Pseudoflavitalea sp. G-6-1-2]
MNTSAELVIRFADLEDIPTIGYLAQQIWPETYGAILSPEQLSYMLDMMYNPEALTDQMTKEGQRFLIAELDEDAVGYASYAPTEDEGVFHLHKIYVHPKTQGSGVGRALLDFVIEQILEEGAAAIRLNVNRYNKARNFYEKLGFTVTKEVDIEIGNGYQMNDYVMEKPISKAD